MIIVNETQSTPVPENTQISDIRATPFRAQEVNLRDALGAEYKTTNPFPVKTPAPSGGPGSAVTLYDASGNPIASTSEAGGFSLNSHLTNQTIEGIIGAAFGTLVLRMGGTDGTNTQGLKVDASGRQQIRIGVASAATLSNVAGSASNVTLLASNTARLKAYFYNDSSAASYIKLGATASTSSFTVKVFPGGYYELPDPVYTGQIDCLWDSATGTMRITEIS